MLNEGMKAAKQVTANNLHDLAHWCHGHTWAASVVVKNAAGMERQAHIGDTIVEFADGTFDVVSAVEPLSVLASARARTLEGRISEALRLHDGVSGVGVCPTCEEDAPCSTELILRGQAVDALQHLRGMDWTRQTSNPPGGEA